MSSRKLSDSDKRDILELYRHPGETTLTLASRYGVSSSTISRILKSSLSESEYENLIQEKRSGRFQSSQTDAELASHRAHTDRSVDLESATIRRIRKRSSASGLEEETLPVYAKQLDLLTSDDEEDYTNEYVLEERYQAEVTTLHEMLGEDLLDEDDLDDEEDDDEEDLDFDESLLSDRRPRTRTLVQILPIAKADLDLPCYVVVDRAAELITRPLKEFGELGKIPPAEVQEKTLPVFDNHRVARRFSNRNQRVIKVPDGRMLQKTATYLQEKGITRLLIDGQVYAL